MPRKLKDAAVVITGASSGIGRATALLCARRGASLVLAARQDGPLQEVAAQCRNLGGQGLAMPTDVADERHVDDLARLAIENFGRIDVWINNAAVTMFGCFEETPPEAFRRVIEINLFGYIHGARAVLPFMREQGNGVIINVSSIAGAVGQPFTSAYVTSKFAIRGFSESLRQELRETDIHVCTVLPASIDTPIFQHGANFMGRAARPMAPTYEAERVAEAIAHCAEHPRAEVYVGNAGYVPGRFHEVVHTIAPGLHEGLVAAGVEKQHFIDRPVAPSSGNVFNATSAWNCVSGGWRQPNGQKGISLKRATGLVAVAALALAGAKARNRPGGTLRDVPQALTKAGKPSGGVREVR